MKRNPKEGEKIPAALTKLVAPHIDSFDYFLNEGMFRVVEGLEHVEVSHFISEITCVPV